MIQENDEARMAPGTQSSQDLHPYPNCGGEVETPLCADGLQPFRNPGESSKGGNFDAGGRNLGGVTRRLMFRTEQRLARINEQLIDLQREKSDEEEQLGFLRNIEELLQQINQEDVEIPIQD